MSGPPPFCHVWGFGDVRYQAPEVIAQMIDHVSNSMWKYPEMRDFLAYNDPQLMKKIENLVLILCGIRPSRPAEPVVYAVPQEPIVNNAPQEPVVDVPMNYSIQTVQLDAQPMDTSTPPPKPPAKRRSPPGGSRRQRSKP